MLSTRVCTLPGRIAAHARRAALFSSAMVEGGHPCLGSRLTFDPKTCSIGFMSGLRAGQSMTSTSCWSKKAAMSRAVWGGALSWTYTKLRPNTTVAHENIYSSGSGCPDAGSWLHPPRPAHSSSPWWIAPHTMTDGTRFPSLGWTQASTSPSPCLRRTRTRPSLWYRENRDSSLKIQCLHCPRSHTLCLLPHSWQRHLCSKVSPGHLPGRRDQYLAARSRLRMV